MPNEKHKPCFHGVGADMDLKQLRKLAGLTQFELAQRCGVSRMRLSLAECGQVKLREDEQSAVRTVLIESIETRASQLRSVLSERQALPV